MKISFNNIPDHSRSQNRTMKLIEQPELKESQKAESYFLFGYPEPCFIKNTECLIYIYTYSRQSEQFKTFIYNYVNLKFVKNQTQKLNYHVNWVFTNLRNYEENYFIFDVIQHHLQSKTLGFVELIYFNSASIDRNDCITTPRMTP